MGEAPDLEPLAHLLGRFMQQLAEQHGRRMITVQHSSPDVPPYFAFLGEDESVTIHVSGRPVLRFVVTDEGVVVESHKDHTERL